VKLERQTAKRAGPPLGAIYGGVAAVGAALAALWLRLGLPRPVCYFHEWTGLPCPSCGSTRLVESLLAGDPLGAVRWNPLIFLVLAGVAVWALVSTARVVLGLPAWSIELTRPERRALRLLGVTALAAGWAYLLWSGV
jgi:hypothetical protein